MNRWLLKSEPSSWSWDDQRAAGTSAWDGVRNHQAANFMRAMRMGDEAFFYHSGEGKEIVGIVRIAREFHPDPQDATGKFGLIDVQALRPLKRPVTLAEIKAAPALAALPLVKQSRLSVSPVADAEWRIILAMADA